MRIGVALLLMSFAAWAGPPLIHQDFARDASGWTSFGAATANIHVIHDPLTVRNGKSALAIEYESSATKPAIAVLPIPGGLAGMKSLSAWLMADSPTAAAIFLSEKEGGRYVAVVWLEPQAWQRIELTPEDFVLAMGPADPKDPDGKLDLDQVQAVGIFDVSQIFSGLLGDSKAPIAVDVHGGAHKLLVDDFEVGTETPSWYKPRTPFQIDNFLHPGVGWLTLGGVDFKLDTDGKVIPGNCLQASYQQTPDRFVVMIRPLPPMDLRTATHIAFDIASDKASTLVLSLEEIVPGKDQGPRYSTNFEVEGGGKPAHREIALSSLEIDQNGPPDPTGKLDLEKLKSLTLVDITAAFTQQESVNTIHLAHVEAVKKTKIP
jgi:hypothetical protein